MGVVNSKKREVKAYASKYSNSLMQYSSSTSSSQQQQQQQQTNSSISHKKADSVKTKTSIYSTESAASASITANTSKSITTQKAASPEPRPFFSETASVLQNAHQSNSFYLPKDWDLKEYQYNVCDRYSLCVFMTKHYNSFILR